MGSTTILNEFGDTTIAWTADRDAEMAAIIARKMKDGVTFFIIDEDGARSQLEAATVAAIKKAVPRRRLAIPDADLLKFVESGAGAEMKTPPVKRGRTRVSRDAAEVAQSHSVGVRQMRGG